MWAGRGAVVALFVLVISFSLISVTLANTSRGPILIEGDRGFLLEGLKGSGTEDDPYVIEGWVIDASSADGICVRNTGKYLTIRNCEIVGNPQHVGIRLENVAHVRVENCRTRGVLYSLYLEDAQGRAQLIGGGTITSFSTEALVTPASQLEVPEASSSGTVEIGGGKGAAREASTGQSSGLGQLPGLGDTLATAVLEGRLGAVLAIERARPTPVYQRATFEVSSEMRAGGIEVRVSSSEREGRTVMINIDEQTRRSLGLWEIRVLVDGEPIGRADDLTDVLDPNNDGGECEYLLLVGANGVQVLVSIPHFSVRTITIKSFEALPVPAPSVPFSYVPLQTATNIVLISLILLFVFRSHPIR